MTVAPSPGHPTLPNGQAGSHAPTRCKPDIPALGNPPDTVSQPKGLSERKNRKTRQSVLGHRPLRSAFLWVSILDCQSLSIRKLETAGGWCFFILSQTFVPKITILRISIFTDITPPRINSTDTDFIIWNLKFIFNVSISQSCIHSPATSLGTTLCGCVCVCAIILVLCFRARVCYWAPILCFCASGSNDCSYSYRLSPAAWLLNWSVSESLPPNALHFTSSVCFLSFVLTHLSSVQKLWWESWRDCLREWKCESAWLLGFGPHCIKTFSLDSLDSFIVNRPVNFDLRILHLSLSKSTGLTDSAKEMGNKCVFVTGYQQQSV